MGQTGSQSLILCCWHHLFFKNIYLFIWLRQDLLAAHGIFSCGMWHLVP